MDREQIVNILHKSINGTALTEAEKKDLTDWIEMSDHNRKLYDEIVNSGAFLQDVRGMMAFDSKPMWGKISKELPVKKNSVISIFSNRIVRYAAAILVILASTATYYMLTRPAPNPQPVTGEQHPIAQDIAPGTEKATLTLADGSVIVLDDASKGKIAEQGNTTVLKEDGLLAYNSDKHKPQDKTFYNTISTNKATYFYSLVLADGSKVWLNSISSITFPTAFTGKERVVDITGEAYFEVAKNPSKPFKVNVKDRGMTVQVLGTHFNINAYNDESNIRTTLLEGAVKISAGGKMAFLRPGQQAKVSPPIGGGDSEGAGVIEVADNADLDEVVAWKNGQFSFQKQDIETIMRQVSRCYDVQVVFQDKISGHYVARVPRNVPISELLKRLEMAGGVHFDIDASGKKITVRH